jgi:hypothetical protein
LNPERKRETPGIGLMSLVGTIELHIYIYMYVYAYLYILTDVYVCAYIYFIIYNVQTYSSYTSGGRFKQGLQESEDFIQ